MNHEKAEYRATVIQKVRQGLHVNGLNRKGSLITSVNSQPKTYAKADRTNMSEVMPIRKMSVSIV